jgi:hypothetical protein
VNRLLALTGSADGPRASRDSSAISLQRARKRVHGASLEGMSCLLTVGIPRSKVAKTRGKNSVDHFTSRDFGDLLPHLPVYVRGGAADPAFVT